MSGFNIYKYIKPAHIPNNIIVGLIGTCGVMSISASTSASGSHSAGEEEERRRGGGFSMGISGYVGM
jgi:hypothetical protein